jgi:carbonic anhydrase
MPPRYFLFLALALLPCAAGAEEPPIWSYNGAANSSDEWGTLDPSYARCTLSQTQSPITIDDTFPRKLPPITLHYGTAHARMGYKDRTVVTDISHGQTLSDGNHVYALKEMRMHSPAEHTVFKKFSVLELQFMHADKDGKMLILSVLAEIGAKNDALQPLLDAAPGTAGTSVPVTFDLAALVPDVKKYYAYTGSLTIPPCTEGVEWRIAKQYITISKEQLVQAGKVLRRNARIVQGLNDRTVYETKD